MMNVNEIISEQLNESARIKELIRDTQTEQIGKVAEVIIQTIQKGGKVLVCGNGGSAADSQHFVAEMVCRYLRERAPIPFIALTTNSSVLTATGNDYHFEKIFVRQVQAIGRVGDILFGISTSGNSQNVLQAFNKAKELGMTTVALTGNNGQLAEIGDYSISVNSKETPRIQEGHITIIHILCDLIESAVVEGKIKIDIS